MPTTSRSTEPRFPALSVLLRIALLLAVFFLTAALGYRAYLANPEVTAVEPLPARHPAVASRAVLFIVDAFHPGRTSDPSVMPALVRLAARGASGVARTGPVTTTAPGIYSLTTGRPGNLVQAIFNFDSSETRVDSLPSLIAASGGKIALGGDPAWHKQFGWLVPPEDRHESPEPGITVDHAIDEFDAQAITFLLAKIADPAYRLLIVHLGSIDAVGHMVTPNAPRYFEQLTFMDGLIARVVDALDLETTLILVTGDHGMAARGTHGGEEEARLTPYVLAGPGVKRGVVADVPQTAFSSTLSALLGLPFLPVSEHPPLAALLNLPGDAATALATEYFEGKLRAAERVGTPPVSSPAVVDEAVNGKLNEMIFGAEDPRSGLRLLTAVAATLGVLIAAMLAWRSVPVRSGRPRAVAHLALSAALPAAIAFLAMTFVWARGLFAFRSTSIAMCIVAGLLALIVTIAWALHRSPRLLQLVTRWHVSLFLPALIVLTAPLINSHWLRPRPYFELLLLGATVAFAASRRPAAGDRAHMVVRLPAMTAAAIYAPQLPTVAWQGWPALLVLSGLVLWLALRNIRNATDPGAILAPSLLGALFAAAWTWRAAGGTGAASFVLVLFVLVVLSAVLMRARAVAAAALLIGASAGLFLIMASDTHEALVFLVAALGALLLSTVRIDLTKPGVIYLVAAAAVLLRICLYFELGDQYNLSSIRTAPGFLLADYGLPLGTVIALLLLKYSLPWLLIFATVLPSLMAAGQGVALHWIDLLALGYVARFAAVAAVIDPFRILPNGMDGIVGMFCVSWAEFVTFGMAAVLVAVLVRPSSVARTDRALAAA